MVLSILVENTSGVLTRVAGLFARRGYNIDSLTVAATENAEFSRMTVVATGDEQILAQIKKQVAKLEDVIDIRELTGDMAVCRELVMIKVKANAKERQAVLSTAEVFRAKVVDLSPDSMMIELTGSQNKIDAFLKLFDQSRIVEMVRTGVTGLPRGSYLEEMF